MTAAKLEELFRRYDGTLYGLGAKVQRDEPWSDPDAELNAPCGSSNDHLRWMCQEALSFITTKRLGKAMRWLGFVQGLLLSKGIYTLEQLKEHSTPEPGTEDGETSLLPLAVAQGLVQTILQCAATLSKVDHYFGACAAAWAAGDGQLMNEAGQPIAAAVGLDQLANEAGRAVGMLCDSLRQHSEFNRVMVPRFSSEPPHVAT